MSFLIADQERFALRPGRNTLGGRGADAVTLTSLAGLAPAAVITVRPDGTALIQRIAAAIIVKVDGGPLGALPHPLNSGARLAIGHARLTYMAATPEREAAAAGAPDKSTAAGPDDKPSTPTEVIEVMSAPVVGGRLIELGTGCVYPVPRDGLVIGRGAECDIPVDDPGVSRRHAVVKPGRGGFVASDESANGTFVNGKRITGAQPLKHGDVLGIGTEEFRIDVDATPYASTFQTPSAAQVELIGNALEPDPLSLISSRRTAPPAPAPPAPLLTPVPPSAAALAVLEVARGPFVGRTFRIERPVCAVGRGDHNEIRLNDASVSSSHATLLLKRGTWYVVDLQSANGTYVDGYRVATERALADGGSLRVGDIVMKFRLLAAHRESPSATRGGGGIWRKIRRIWAS